MSQQLPKILRPSVWIPIGLVMGMLFAYGCRALDSGSGAVSFRKQVFALKPGNVQAIEIERGEVNGVPGVRYRRELSREEIATFLTLVRETQEYQPNHPDSQWMYWVRVTSTGSGGVALAITETSNNGTFMNLWSQGSHGANYGVFRNDELKPFLEQLFAAPSQTP